MAPIRRYLRITKYSVLECRIYLENPALAQSWLLNPRDPVLPRVIETVRPLVLPKLREEKELERMRKKNSKKRSIKDVVTVDDFEVSIFLTETSIRHSLLYKHKHFRDKTQTKLTSNSTRLTGASREVPIDIDGRELQVGPDSPVLGLREEETVDNGAIVWDDIPMISETEAGLAVAPTPATTIQQSKKRRHNRSRAQGEEEEHSDEDEGDHDDDDDGFEVMETDASADGASGDTDGGNSDDEASVDPPPSKRRKGKEEAGAVAEAKDDNKKKLAMDISYEGFAIYGRVLCLVIKRRDFSGSGSGSRSGSGHMATSNKSQTGPSGGQATMENWISSTQMPAAAAADELDV